MTSLKTSIKTITYLSDIGCLEIQGASLKINRLYPVCFKFQITRNCLVKCWAADGNRPFS
ncbi:hypothetical protein AWP98_10670 [Escherichia coli]|nr:hypothetical protein AWP86_07440 [Escherichia coli]OKX67577.1 hypothetical protein AWP98_10670 [Escherichia coli]